MATYLSSDRVTVFPYSNYRPTQPSSRTLNEYNLSNLVRHLTDYQDYILSYGSNIIEFILHGYYFKLNLDSIQLSTENPTYAVISMMGEYTDGSEVLNGGDNSKAILSGDGSKSNPYELDAGISQFIVETSRLRGANNKLYFYYKYSGTSNTGINVSVRISEGVAEFEDSSCGVEEDSNWGKNDDSSATELKFSPTNAEDESAGDLKFHIGVSHVEQEGSKLLSDSILLTVTPPDADSKDTTFYGIQLRSASTVEELPENSYYLKLFEADGSICKDSFRRFDCNKSLGIRYIGGGNATSV